MKLVPIEELNQPFAIEFRQLENWEKRPHRHNFFELVYIEEGSGEQCINRFKSAYTKGSIFLLPPWDCHSFTINLPTKFVFIRFTGLFFNNGKNSLIDYSSWFQHLHYILSSYNKVPGDIIRNEEDKQHAEMLIKGIWKEYLKNDRYSENIIRSNMVSVLNILTRNVEQILIHSNNADQHFGYILNYIQHNLLDREKLRLSELSKQFNIAPTYFGEYFKKHAGESLQDYIIRSRLKLAEARILHTDQSLKETAFELGFTDSSHLSKMLKKYSNTSLDELRKKKEVADMA